MYGNSLPQCGVNVRAPLPLRLYVFAALPSKHQTNFLQQAVFLPFFFVGTQTPGTRKSRWSRVRTSKIILDFYPDIFGPVNHGQNWKGWERSGEKGLIISDNQAETCLIITINDTSIGDLPLIITISDTCKNQPKRLDFDNTINLSSLIVSLALQLYWKDQ
jgi:hypothetical protein